MALQFGIIEWTSGKAPTLIMGPTWVEVDREAVALLAGMLADHHTLFADCPDFVKDNPIPDLRDNAAVEAWLEELHETTTSPWYTRVRDEEIIIG